MACHRITEGEKMKTILLVSLLASSSLSCSDVGVSSRERDFNVRLRYGILARNEINTFQNTYTKDLILDGTVTVPYCVQEIIYLLGG